MRVLFISTNTSGGAGLSAYRLHRALIAKGVDSLMLVKNKNIDDTTIIGPKNKMEKFYHRLWYRLDKIPAKFFHSENKNLHSPALFSSLSLRQVKKIKPDIIHLRWITGGFVSPKDIAKLAKIAPIVWELSDAWAFTGANHFAENDFRWRDGYQKNNRPTNERGFDLNRWVFERKQKAWKNLNNMTITAQSNWMADRSRQSLLLKKYQTLVIPVGIDVDFFHPVVEKNILRQKLNLPPDKKIILFGAADAASDKKKGFAYLLDAARLLAKNNLSASTTLAIFGSPKPEEKIEAGLPIIWLGKINDPKKMAELYAAADVFCAPYLEDNFPSTILEAMACGTPTVAFAAGGVPDIITHKQDGYLSKALDAEDLARGLIYILEGDDRRKKIAAAARKKIEENFTLEKQVNRYVELYKKILDEKK
jgi:glycosyltransferase involved in cell wall biosynthesis